MEPLRIIKNEMQSIFTVLCVSGKAGGGVEVCSWEGEGWEAREFVFWSSFLAFGKDLMGLDALSGESGKGKGEASLTKLILPPSWKGVYS